MRRSQCIFCARSLSVEIDDGRMTQRTTRAMVRGLRGEEESSERNLGMETERANRWRVQIGMLNNSRRSENKQSGDGTYKM